MKARWSALTPVRWLAGATPDIALGSARSTVWVLIASLMLLAGCGRHADPLEWKIEASHPAEMQEWLEQNLALMPAKTARELRACISNIQITLPPNRSGEPQEQANKLCSRLNGKTVRAILVEGNELSHRMLLARAKNLSDELIRLMGAGEGATEEQRDQQLRGPRTCASNCRP